MSPRPNRGGDLGRRAPSRTSAATAGPAAAMPVAERIQQRGDFGSASPDLISMLPPDWEKAIYLALDFETTGLDPARERVVEIGAIRFVPVTAGLSGAEGRRATELGAMASLVKPGIRMPREVIAIHGITDEDVEDAPPFKEVAPALSALASGAYIVAHNAPFDLAFLRAELARAGLPPPLNPVIDTRLLAKAAFPGLSSYRLVHLASRFGIEPGRAHRALDDARTCMDLLVLCASRAVRAS